MSKEMIRRSFIPNAQRLTTREKEGDGKYIEGYFVVFNELTELWPGTFEKVAPGAGDKALEENDYRVLYNHNSDFPLGRKSAGTAKFHSDEKGIWGSVRINEEDSAAVDAYARVKRGDITGCSYGYWPISESYEDNDDGSVTWTVLEADIREFSVCTFPAYEQTEIEARSKEYRSIRENTIERRKQRAKKRLEEITKC